MHYTSGLWPVALWHFATARHHYRHEALQIHRRQDVPASPTTTDDVSTYITPSPGASPVAVTSQSQLVTTYVAQFTLCESPPEAFFPVTATPTASHPTTAPYSNYSVSIPPGNGTCTTIYSPTLTQVCATVLNGLATRYTVSSCNQEITFSTDYGFVLFTNTPEATPSFDVSSLTAVGRRQVDGGDAGADASATATADAGAGADAVPTSSAFEGAFTTPSSDTRESLITPTPDASASFPDINSNGTASLIAPNASAINLNATLITQNASSATATTNLSTPDTSTITPGPTVETITTYYLAPWEELTTAGPPANVEKKICQTLANGTLDCILEYEVWKSTIVTLTTSTVTSINLTTEISGPSQVIVETFVANVTELLTTSSSSTTMQLEYAFETDTISRSTVVPTSTGPTMYETFTLSPAEASLTSTATSTSTMHVTTTVYVQGTTTALAPTDAAVQTAASPDVSSVVASLLGVGQ